jgi:hypothetical protein
MLHRSNAAFAWIGGGDGKWLLSLEEGGVLAPAGGAD